MMDGAPGPVGDPLKIVVVPNPVFTTINLDDQKQISGSAKSITIIVCVNRNRPNPCTYEITQTFLLREQMCWV